MRNEERVNNSLMSSYEQPYGVRGKYKIFFRDYTRSPINDLLVGVWLAWADFDDPHYYSMCGTETVGPYTKGQMFPEHEKVSTTVGSTVQELDDAASEAFERLTQYLESLPESKV